MIALSRPYICTLGAPQIDRVDERIFILRYYANCVACGFCGDQCCSYGVDIDAANIDRLLGLGAEFARFIGIPAAGWFTAGSTVDSEFPSGAYARTQTHQGKCVFASPARGCRIHAWCVQQGLDHHVYKPLVSTLFPLTFEYGALVPSEEVIAGSLICSQRGVTLYQGVRTELAYYFGASLVTELDERASLSQ